VKHRRWLSVGLGVSACFAAGCNGEDLLAGPARLEATRAFPLREPATPERRLPPPPVIPVEEAKTERNPSVEVARLAGRRALVWIEESSSIGLIFALYEDGLVTYTHFDDGAPYGGATLHANIGRARAAELVDDVARDGFFDMPPFYGGDTGMCGSHGRRRAAASRGSARARRYKAGSRAPKPRRRTRRSPAWLAPPTGRPPTGSSHDWDDWEKLHEEWKDLANAMNAHDDRRVVTFLGASCAESFKGKIAVATCASTYPLTFGKMEVSFTEVAHFYERAKMEARNEMQRCATKGGWWDERSQLRAPSPVRSRK
jgi:hypothetical protein